MNRAAVAIAVLVSVIVLLAGALVWLWITRDDVEVAATSPTTTATTTTTTASGQSTTTAPRSTTPTTTAAAPTSAITVPPTTAPAGPPPSPEELDAVVAELSSYVERRTELAYTERVKATMLPSDAFEQRVREEIAESGELLLRQERMFKALGLISRDANLATLEGDLLAPISWALYDPSAKELLVRQRPITPYLKEHMVYALTNAIDDQNFGLHRPELLTTKDEAAFGLAAVTQGHALRVEQLYLSDMAPADRQIQMREQTEAAAHRDAVFATVPEPVRNLMALPSRYGPELVQLLHAGGGPAELAEAFETPITSSANVMHPTQHLRGQKPVAVPAPKAEGKEIDEGVFGEALLLLTLTDGAPDVARVASEGWAGDHYVVWEQGSGTGSAPSTSSPSSSSPPGSAAPPSDICIRIDFKMASSKDLSELESAFQTWSKRHAGTNIQNKGDVLEVTRCLSGSAGGRSTL